VSSNILSNQFINESTHTKLIFYYIKHRQVKTEYGVSGREGGSDGAQEKI
jgi:hypothetical protein